MYNFFEALTIGFLEIVHASTMQTCCYWFEHHSMTAVVWW